MDPTEALGHDGNEVRGVVRGKPGVGVPATVAVAMIAIAAYVGTLSLVAGPSGVLFGLATHVAFALPGMLIVRLMLRGSDGWLSPLAFGPIVGTALSSLALLLLWTAGGRGAWLFVGAPIIAAALAWPARTLGGRMDLPRTVRPDWLWLALLLTIVPLVVARPFSLVGADVPEGRVYRAYFTADYVWRRAVVAELAKGDFLPENPFYEGDALHYYWLPHLPRALEYRVAGRFAGLDSLLLVGSVLSDAMFVACLYGVGRMFAPPWAAAGGVACAVLFSSFEGAYALWDHWRVDAPYELIRYLNIDAITRWMFQGMPIDGLQRVLLYQPHHALGYAMGYLGLLAVVRRVRREDPAILGAAGALLGLSVLISSFGGLMFTAIAAVHEGLSVLRARDWRRAAAHALAAGLPLAAAAALVIVLQYVDRGGRVISIGLNPVAVHNVVVSTALSLGPVLILGGAGVWLAWRYRRMDLGVFATLTLVSVLFYFFVDVRDHQDVYVGWRVGHFLLMGSAVLIAVVLEAAGRLRGGAKAVAAAGIAAVILAAAPTVLIDIYNTQDVANRRMGPGFRWTLLLTPDELEAFAWIRTHTSSSAVFQVDPWARHSETWAYLPAFAERRMAIGLPISMIPLAKYEQGSRLMRDMFSMSEAAGTYELATKFRINYLLTGPPERFAHPGLQTRLDERADLFPLLFRNGTISIYGVASAGP